MAEVHRYKVLKMKSEDGGVLTYTPEGPEIVMASAYDALLSDNTALRAQQPSQGGEAVLVSRDLLLRAIQVLKKPDGSKNHAQRIDKRNAQEEIRALLEVKP